MKHVLLRYGLILTLFAAVSLGAFDSEAAMPAGDMVVYGSYLDTEDFGSTAGMGFKVAFGEDRWKFDMAVSYYPDLSADWENILEGVDTGELPDADQSAIPIDAGISFHLAPESTYDFFVAGGVSYYLLDVEGFEVDDELGYYAGAGIQTGGGGFGFYVDALYRSVEGTMTGEDLEDVELSEEADFDLSGFSIAAGIKWSF